MSTHKQSGFTIIEVMLFLAVTGALAVAILVGSGFAIEQQRYRDSVNSFKSLIQEQYAQIANVINSDAKNPQCTLTDDDTRLAFNDSEEAKSFRGTSDCLVLGRFLLIEEKQVTAYDVIGEPSSAAAAESSDSAMLQKYGIALRAPNVSPVSWDARIVKPKTTEGVTTSLMIVRSPLSGTILTYVRDGDHHGSPQSIVSDGNMVQKDFCVDFGGSRAAGKRLAVRIAAKAANQSAIEIPLDTDAEGNKIEVCD